MTLKYLSVCSGIEAATVAWHPLGWVPFGFAEIEAFPSAVLAHHYGSNLPGESLTSNGVPNFGNMERFNDWPDCANLDVLVGGTPCQSFSVAGLRKGLADPRGNLALVYLGIVDRYRPEWFVWENVPGVLSSNGGRDFGSFLGGIQQLGYGFSYRVLDAQYIRVDGFGRAVPQRRRRVFVIGNSTDWRRAAAVLFEPESMSGNPPPRRQAREDVAPTISARTKGGGGLGTDFDCDGGLIAKSVLAGGHSNNPLDENLVAHALRADGFDASEDGTGRGTPIIPVVAASLTRGAESSGKGGYAGRRQEDDVNIIAFAQNSRDEVRLFGGDGGVVGALAAEPGMKQTTYVAFGIRNDAARDGEAKTPSPDADGHVRLRNPGLGIYEELSPTVDTGAAHTVAAGWAVRRLTPLECERLQGFPDGYTHVEYPIKNLPLLRGKAKKLADVQRKYASDGPRYKGLGNSMAVNAMRWLGRRIEYVKALVDEDAA